MLTHKDIMNKAIIRRNLLAQYIDKEYSENIKHEIEDVFNPYKLFICDIDYYYLENYLINTIRCVIKDGKITKLCFN